MLRLRVPISGSAATVALDRLLAVAPFGVHELADALVVHAPSLPDTEEMRAALGVAALEVTEVDESPAIRLSEIARPEPVDGRMLIRATWMAPLDGVQEVMLADATAFGTGAHPTTRDCLSMLLALEPGGAFADLGCGAGVLAIAAARLGWEPVVAVDVAARAVRATRTNAEANGVAVEALEADLLTSPPPAAPTAAANVPVEVHVAMAAAWEEPPEHLIVSGVHADDRAAILAAYAQRGLGVAEERAADPWLTLLLRRGAPAETEAAPDATAAAGSEPASAPPPEPSGERFVELGARASLFDVPGGIRFDVWALDDSLRWALRGPYGTAMEVVEETRLPIAEEEHEGRPPSTVRLLLDLSTPAIAYRVEIHVTVASADAGLVRVGGSARIVETTLVQS